MLTQAPLPSWSDLVLALVRRMPSGVDQTEMWHRNGESAGWLSRSAWSLALIALWRKNCAHGTVPTVWVPDFFCNSSLLALRCTGAKLVFYPVTPTLQPDMTQCRSLAASSKPDVFLLVHYFGEPAVAAPARDFCKLHGAWLIEDAAHVLRPVAGIGFCGDFVLYSPHKHLAVPDGAVLVVRPDGPAQFDPMVRSSFGAPADWSKQLLGLCAEMGSLVNSSQSHAVVWLVKRILQKLGLRSSLTTNLPFAEPSFSSLESNISPSALIAPRRSFLGKRLLGCCACKLGEVASLRQRRLLLWDDRLLAGAYGQTQTITATARPIGRTWTPYLGAYQLTANAAPVTYESWRGRGLPATTWPDLPPEVVQNPNRHSNALHLRNTRLYLPVHQTLNVLEMLKNVDAPQPHASNEPSLRAVWGNISEDEWTRLSAQAMQSNLLQSWDYGEAKSAESGWRVARCVFYRFDEPIAFLQLLQKRVAGFILVSRLNRGPVLLRTSVHFDEFLIWKKLASLGNLWGCKLLSASPELRLSGQNLHYMARLGFKQFLPRAWESIWLDLTPDLKVLRQRLDAKWRNALTSSEKAGLTLHISDDGSSYDWMMTRYQELMKTRSFQGVPVSLLVALQKRLPPSSKPVVLRALHGGEVVAAVCLAHHGSAATYLLGWNGALGRNIKANQYLLWQAILHLKASGVMGFDLGGINAEDTFGITAFKLGLGGERYELVGEYWKW
jgi:hypothetical protein